MWVSAPSIIAVVPGSGLLFGLLLAAAIVGGYLARTLRCPRVIGYLLAGVAVHCGLKAVLQAEPDSSEMARLKSAAMPLQAIKDLGLGLILFSIGGIFERRRLTAIGWRLLRLSLADTAATLLLVFGGVALVLLIAGGDLPIGTRLGFALLLGTAAIATAPAATLVTLREYEAKGPATETILGLTGLNNLICIVLFQVVFLGLAAAGVLPEVRLRGSEVWLGLIVGTIGSILLGTILGLLLSVIHARMHLAETLLIFVAAMIVLGAGEEWLLEHHRFAYNDLLTVLVTGAVFTNVAIDPERLETTIRTMGGPILVGFFVLAGYRLHVEELVALGGVGTSYVVCRAAAKYFGVRWGVRSLRGSADIPPNVGAALLCQAAVVIGLADLVQNNWPHRLGNQFATVVLGSVVIYEIAGPLLVKWVAVGAGEVKAVTLLRRGNSRGGQDSVWALTWHAFLRMLGRGTPLRVQSDEPYRVRHIMRSNVKCISASAGLPEVLAMVEQSRLNHFPVTDHHDQLIGIIHFRDIREMIYNPLLADLVTASDLVRPGAKPLFVDMPLDDALQCFHEHEVGSLPVVDGPHSRRVVGVVEQRDLLRALHGKPGGK